MYDVIRATRRVVPVLFVKDARWQWVVVCEQYTVVFGHDASRLLARRPHAGVVEVRRSRTVAVLVKGLCAIFVKRAIQRENHRTFEDDVVISVCKLDPVDCPLSVEVVRSQSCFPYELSDIVWEIWE